MADDSSDGSEKDRNAPTVRELRPAGSPGDTMPDITGQYVPPRPLPEASQHRTLDLKSVRLSDQADPRRWLTERRLVSPAQPEEGGASMKWWLVGGLALLLGIWAWVIFGGEQPPKAQTPEVAAPATATAAPVPAAPARTAVSAGHVPTSPPPVASTAADRAALDRAPERAEAPAAASVAPKAPAAREPAKKRRDPWLE